MKQKALVVEDEKELGLLLAEHLRRWGYEPAILSEGQSVISWVRQHQPSLILLDLLLPDMVDVDKADIVRQSWAKLREFNVRTIYPGHGPIRPMPSLLQR